MVRVTHSYKKKSVSKDVSGPVSVMLGNGTGNYLFLSDTAISRYQGFFVKHNKGMLRILESIEVHGRHHVDHITNKFSHVERTRGSVTEKMHLPSHTNSLVYELDASQSCVLNFDIKESYDQRIWGRHYTVRKEKNCMVVDFTKKTDGREDPSEGEVEYRLYVAIKSDGTINPLDAFVEHHYPLDQARRATPTTRYVFQAAEVKGSVIVISASDTKTKAIKECNQVFAARKQLLQKDAASLTKLIASQKILSKIKNKERHLAYVAAITSLTYLTNHDPPGVFAGFPWFFQLWARDELIALKGVMLTKQTALAKKILAKNLELADTTGSISTNTHNTLASADALGWLFVRLADFDRLAKNKKALGDYAEIVDKAFMHQTQENFAVNKGKETWMDSLDRSGIRIEIQALRLATYAYLKKKTKKSIYRYLEEKLAKSVRDHFWNKKYLNDGLHDVTLRPNLFIAAYVYPALLAKKEWAVCFESALKALWLSWGGISTVDKKSPYFVSETTGEDNLSYHNGDSWFWINNLAALVMARASSAKFKKYISQVSEASTQEILWMGALSHHAELSSASSLQSQGCQQQAWSNAMFVELMQQIYGKK